MAELNINKAEFIKSAAAPAGFIRDALPNIVFSGKSNVGKSSLINSLTRIRGLARVSSQPGKTQTINFFELTAKILDKETKEETIRKDFYLVDLPGYGYAKTGKERRKIWKKFIDEYLLTSPQLQFVCQLIDIRHEPMASDIEMFQWLVENNIPVLIVATKADKLGKNARQKNVAAIRCALGVKELSILPYSSVKNEGRSDLLDVIRDILV